MKSYIYTDISINDYEGTGNTIIFAHAFPLSSSMWRKQVDYLKNKYRIITYDIRGLGKSKFADYQYTMETFADDFLNIIEHIGAGKIVACGLSMGGYIIQRALVKRPELFKAVILADTRGERDDDNGIILRSNTIAKIKTGQKDLFFNDFSKKLIWEKNYQNKELVSCLNEIFSKQTIEGICGALIAMATRVNSHQFLKDIKIPCLIICGKYDVLTPLKCSEDLNKSLSNSVLKIIDNSGHLSNMENPDEFNVEVEKFLESIK